MVALIDLDNITRRLTFLEKRIYTVICTTLMVPDLSDHWLINQEIQRLSFWLAYQSDIMIHSTKKARKFP